jgi:xylan 1,4-beta-xylosidase
VVEFEPEHYQQAAGLICYYGGNKFHYLYVCRDEDTGKHVRVMSAFPEGPAADSFTPPIPVPSRKRIELCAEVDYSRLRFAYRVEGVDRDWRWLPELFDATILSDEATAPGAPNFTGAFVGMACQDLAGTRRPADFDWFEYRGREYRARPSGGSAP